MATITKVIDRIAIKSALLFTMATGAFINYYIFMNNYKWPFNYRYIEFKESK